MGQQSGNLISIENTPGTGVPLSYDESISVRIVGEDERGGVSFGSTESQIQGAASFFRIWISDRWEIGIGSELFWDGDEF